jgi:hypothetical protein
MKHQFPVEKHFPNQPAENNLFNHNRSVELRMFESSEAMFQ